MIDLGRGRTRGGGGREGGFPPIAAVVAVAAAVVVEVGEVTPPTAAAGVAFGVPGPVVGLAILREYPALCGFWVAGPSTLLSEPVRNEIG